MLIFAFDKTTPNRPRRRQSTQRFDNYIKLNTMALIYCKDCGKQVSDTAANCPYCGSKMRAVNPNASEKDWLTTLLLCFFLGGLGIHSFYTGETTIGVIQLITLGGCGIWALIDFIMIICGNYRDGEGKIVTNNR